MCGRACWLNLAFQTLRDDADQTKRGLQDEREKLRAANIPDTGHQGWQGYLPAYLPVAPESLHAVTHHVYAGVKPEHFNDAATLDESAAEIEWYVSTLRELAPHAQIWAGEHGPIGGGIDGARGKAGASCGPYATTLWYADDLAMRAKAGFSQYQRQDFFGGAYGLTNSMDGQGQSWTLTDPLVLRPGYWLNFMWKRTVGTKVFNATSSISQVRAYAFGESPPSPFAAPECAAAQSMQLVLINLNEVDTPVALPRVGAKYVAADKEHLDKSQTMSLHVSSALREEVASLQAQLNGALSDMAASKLAPKSIVRGFNTARQGSAVPLREELSGLELQLQAALSEVAAGKPASEEMNWGQDAALHETGAALREELAGLQPQVQDVGWTCNHSVQLQRLAADHEARGNASPVRTLPGSDVQSGRQ